MPFRPWSLRLCRASRAFPSPYAIEVLDGRSPRYAVKRGSLPLSSVPRSVFEVSRVAMAGPVRTASSARGRRPDLWLGEPSCRGQGARTGRPPLFSSGVISLLQRTCTTCGAAFSPRTKRTYKCPRHEPRGRASRSPSTRAQRDGTGDYDRNRAIVLAGDPKCTYCPAPATTADHVIAVVKGGTNALDNLVPACGPCNASKQDRDAADWRAV